ncbi:MAG: chitosanase [Pyrinomonadaceae bacterium]
MEFSNTDKLKALAIVNIFETSKPFGNYAACVVLNDGAGVSYGINQFTHRSGSLLAVVNCYLANGGKPGRTVLEAHLLKLQARSARSINSLAIDKGFKKALKAAAVSREMRFAQNQIAFERYLKPAIEACRGSGFTLPLSLAVIYDSINHGSWEKIRDRVGKCDSEKAWITEYVRKRDAWLLRVPRLMNTRYRTRFFLDQIATGRWDLELPLTVHGIKLTNEMFSRQTAKNAKDSAVEPLDTPAETQAGPVIPKPHNSLPKPSDDPQIEAQPPVAAEENSHLERIEAKVIETAARYDRFEKAVTTVVTRKDAAKSLWTTVAGSIWQSSWAIFAFFIGLPREVWLIVAIIAAAFGLFYLYRQIALGKIRERSRKTGGNYA